MKLIDFKRIKGVIEDNTVKLKPVKKFIYLGSVVFIFGLILITLALYNKTNASEKGTITSNGVVEVKEISINSKIPGKITKLHVEEGSHVNVGDVILEISSDELQAKKNQLLAQIEQAQATYEAAKQQTNAAKSNLEKAQNGARKQEIEQAKLAYSLAQKSLNRVNELYTNKYQQTQALIETAKAAYEAAQAQTAAANDVYEKAGNGARKQEIAQVQAQYDLAKASYDRVSKLYDIGAISAQKRDEVKTQLTLAAQALSMAKEGARSEDKDAAYQTYISAQANEEARKEQYVQAQAGLGEVDSTFGLKQDEAEAQVEIRKQALDMAQEGARVEDKSGAQALVAQAQAMEEAAKGKLDQANAGLEEIEAYLKDTVIIAPISGTITELNSNEGELVTTGMSIATLSALDKPWITVNVKETDLKNVNLNQKVNVCVSEYKDKKFTGKVVSINKKPDFATKRATNDNGDFDILSFGVKVDLDKNDDTLKPGMTAVVTFIES